MSEQLVFWHETGQGLSGAVNLPQHESNLPTTVVLRGASLSLQGSCEQRLRESEVSLPPLS